MGEQLTSGDVDRIEARLNDFDEDGGDKAEYLELYVSAADVLRLVTALRAAWAERDVYRRYSMVSKIAIGTGFAPPEAKRLEDEEWTDAQIAEAQAMIDAQLEWLEDEPPDRSAASDEATGEGG